MKGENGRDEDLREYEEGFFLCSPRSRQQSPNCLFDLLCHDREVHCSNHQTPWNHLPLYENFSGPLTITVPIYIAGL